jgi:hypothetical protein
MSIRHQTLNLMHLTASRCFGETEQQALLLAQCLECEVKTTFVSFWEGGLCRAFFAEVCHAGLLGIALEHDAPYLLETLDELTGLLCRCRTDLLCCHGCKADLLGLLAARRCGIPVISILPGGSGERPNVRAVEAIDRRVLSGMDKVVCVSAVQAAKARREGMGRDQIVVIPDFVGDGHVSSAEQAGKYRDLFTRLLTASDGEADPALPMDSNNKPRRRSRVRGAIIDG